MSSIQMLLVVAAGFAAAVFINVAVLPGNHIVSSLYLIPVLVACHRWRAPAVAVSAVAAIALYIVSAQLVDRPTSVWQYGVLALSMGGYLAVRYALHIGEIARLLRKESEDRTRLQIFVGMVAHDLSGAMTSVGAGVTMLERAGIDLEPGEQRVARNAISGGILQMDRLLDDLRNVASIESDGFVLHPGSMDIVDTVRQAIDRQRLASPRHRVTLDAPGTVEGVWDRARVGQLIDNLVSNACKYSPEDEDVQVDVREDPDAVTISICDHGLGIDARHRSMIFEPFARTGDLDERRGLVSDCGSQSRSSTRMAARFGSIAPWEPEAHSR